MKWIDLLRPATRQDILQLVTSINSAERNLMAVISGFSERVKARFNELALSVDGISQDLQQLKKLITDLQNSPGTFTPEDQALLDEIEALVDAHAVKVKELDEATEPSVVPQQ